MFRIEYDRKRCIGAGVCALMSKDFVMNQDGKADLVGGKRNEETGFFEKEIPQESYEDAWKAADGCPKNVIRIFKKDTGEKLI